MHFKGASNQPRTASLWGSSQKSKLPFSVALREHVQITQLTWRASRHRFWWKELGDEGWAFWPNIRTLFFTHYFYPRPLQPGIQCWRTQALWHWVSHVHNPLSSGLDSIKNRKLNFYFSKFSTSYPLAAKSTWINIGLFIMWIFTCFTAKILFYIKGCCTDTPLMLGGLHYIICMLPITFLNSEKKNPKYEFQNTSGSKDCGKENTVLFFQLVLIQSSRKAATISCEFF